MSEVETCWVDFFKVALLFEVALACGGSLYLVYSAPFP